jgi:hypothetical protein
MNTPSSLKYTKTDEWFDPATGALGLTDYAQSQLSDIVFVEVQLEAGETIEAGKPSHPLSRSRPPPRFTPAGQGHRGQQGALRKTGDPEQQPL